MFRHKKIIQSLIFSFLLCALFACAKNTPTRNVEVLLQEGDFTSFIYSKTQKAGTDFSFDITVENTKRLSSCSYDNYSISREELSLNKTYSLTLYKVNYSTTISLEVIDEYIANYVNDEDHLQDKVVLDEYKHTRYNTINSDETFQKEGYQLVGYLNNESVVSLGSRVDRNLESGVTLKPYFLKNTSTSEFEYIEKDSSIEISKYKGNEETIVIPNIINEKKVTLLKSNSFINKNISTLVIPSSVKEVEKNVFVNTNINELVIFDSLEIISDESFNNSSVNKLRINAVTAPHYSANYFDSFPDKMDRLISLKDKKKIVLFAGSSARFGYDSKLIDDSFSDYEVVNMGVYAYSNQLLQIEIIKNYINEDDILILSPEFDTIDTQFNYVKEFDYRMYAMIESNYDLMLNYKINEFSKIFDTYQEYSLRRRLLSEKSYSYYVGDFDEDERRSPSPTYNKYGDYSLYRHNNFSREYFGVRRAIYNKDYFPITWVKSFSDYYKEIDCKKIFSYSPRMDKSVEHTTPTSINELDIYLKENIENMTFIGDINKSLMDPLYFYATDNHLSTEGVDIRTKYLIPLINDAIYGGKK